MQEALNGLIEDVWPKTLASQTLEEYPHLVHSLHVQPWVLGYQMEEFGLLKSDLLITEK